MLCILFLLFAVVPAARGDVWLTKQDRLERIAPDGRLVVTVAEAYGRPIVGIDWIDMLDVDPSDGSVYTIDGGVPPTTDATFGLLRALKLTKDGAPVFEKTLLYPQGVAVDRGRGGVWISVALDEEESARDVLLLDAATGDVRARVHGFQSFVGHMTVGRDGALWVQDWGGANDSWVRLDGAAAELDGYDASADVGDRHERLPNLRPTLSPIAVNAVDGRVWIADWSDDGAGGRQGQLVALSAEGDELMRVSPGFSSVAGLALDSSDGSVWATDDRSEGRLVHVSAQGKIVARLEQWNGIGPIAEDATDESLWAVVYPTVDPATGEGDHELVKLDARGNVLLTIADPDNSILYVEPYAAASSAAAADVDLDIAPFDRRNAVNVRGRGAVVAVALLSDAELDPLQVDAASLRFGVAGAVAIAHWARDVDRDGNADLVALFSVAHAGIKCGDTEASITGETFAGQTVRGSDAIRTVGCGQPSWHWNHHRGGLARAAARRH